MFTPWNRIVAATTNKGKAREFAYRLRNVAEEVCSLDDFAAYPSVAEDGATFLENAEKKARTYGLAFGVPSLADDSGLCVEALNGQPGVYSARYAGDHATDRDNIVKLLRELNRVSVADTGQGSISRSKNPDFRLLSPAYFVCALVLYDPSADKLIRAEGSCAGWIIDTPRGNGGFGYDPVFYLPEYDRTMAELAMERKAAISHRGKALDSLLSLI